MRFNSISETVAHKGPALYILVSKSQTNKSHQFSVFMTVHYSSE